ncbi:sugar ABC transporter substrate-binding protein [uncultured Jatrophihabitans sp.]|uniref:sugar ABC transporter substrate-binding protein n=1 Tax=uncultured Jatrophihabitans sp. TaxID=1610747 RepID=UPI0035CB2BF3
MRKSTVVIAAVGATAALALGACSSSGSGSGKSSAASAGGSGGASSSAASSGSSGSGGTVDGKGAKVGIILPDTISSPRWITADPTALKNACSTYKLSCTIQNANGSAQRMKTIAQQMESSGVKVLMIVDLDAASGAAIEQQAKKAGVITVDYDRLTPGGGAALYVSFDNVKVGQAQGTALTQCPQVKGQKSVQYVDIDGAPTDNNAILFAQGYDSVLGKTPGWTRVGKQTGQWDANTAGRVFNSFLGQHKDIKAVMVANDTMAGAVITDLSRQGLNGKVAVSGQDASAAGLQQIMKGNQCFTIYKPSKLEADPAIKAIAQLANGQAPNTNGVTVTDPKTKTKIPALLATPTVITKANVAQPINDQYTPKNTVCTGSYASLCTQNGVK